MADIKIILKKDETIEQVDNLLFKALDLHASGDVHLEESFDDPAMISTFDQLEKTQKQIYMEMLEEIFMEIDKQYTES
jgi:hypothetical protein